jgi:hypothetical protein
MISNHPANVEVTSVYDQGVQWSRILSCFPMTREQEVSCAKTLQRGWENLDNARKLYDPDTFSAMPKRSTISTELGRRGYFLNCSELHRAASQLSSLLPAKQGPIVQDVESGAISQDPITSTDAVQVRAVLDSVFQSVEEAMVECRSSVIRVLDLGQTPDHSLDYLELLLRPVKKYVETLRGSRPSSAESLVLPFHNNKQDHQASSPTPINGDKEDALWAAVLTNIPLSTLQQANCASNLQTAWHRLDLARTNYMFDPEVQDSSTPSLPDREVSIDLDREGYFKECDELSRAVHELSSHIDAQEARYEDGEPKRAWAESGYSLSQAGWLLGSVSLSVEKVREECRSLDIHVPDWGDETESKLEHLEEEIRRMRRYVRTLEDGIGHGGILTPSGLENQPLGLRSSPSTPTEPDCQSMIT